MDGCQKNEFSLSRVRAFAEKAVTLMNSICRVGNEHQNRDAVSIADPFEKALTL